MGDLVFNGGNWNILNLNLISFLCVYGFFRKVWYLGWKPTVSRMLSSIIYSVNDAIKGSPFEISPSITPKLVSTASGTGVGIFLLASVGRCILMFNQGWTYQRIEFNNCSVCANVTYTFGHSSN